MWLFINVHTYMCSISKLGKSLEKLTDIYKNFNEFHADSAEADFQARLNDFSNAKKKKH